jgi:hypothetical protein
MFKTVNYLFATYLQTAEAGGNKIKEVKKLRPGKAEFYFDIEDKDAKELQLKFHESSCSEFERLRKQTIDLAY